MALSLGDFNDTVGGECPQSGRTGHSGSQGPFVPLCCDRSHATWSPPFLLFSLDTCRPTVRHRLLPGGLPWWFIWLKKGKTFWTVKEELQHSNHGSPKEYNILQVPTQCSSLYLLIFSSFREKALSRSGRRSISHGRWGGFGKVWKHFRLSQCGLGLLLASTELRQGCANHPTMYKTTPTWIIWPPMKTVPRLTGAALVLSLVPQRAGRPSWAPQREFGNSSWFPVVLSIVLYSHTSLNDEGKLLGDFVIVGTWWSTYPQT